MRNIYLDNAAASPTDPRVQKEVVRGMKIYGNPSSFNDSGRKAANELTKARLKVARFLGAHSDEIIFTASGSEANNMAILGIAKAIQKLQILNPKSETLNKSRKSKIPNSKPHIVTTNIEHPSVLEPIKQLEKKGFDITYLPVDKEGFINLDEFKNALRTETVLVSVMYANNEIGTIEPIVKIGKIIKEFRKGLEIRNSKLEIHGTTYPLFHVDACQAAGCLNMNVNNLQADLVTFNGSKIGGPRGVGVLYVRQGVALTPQVLGGGQERGLRAGTENLPAILGLAKAVELVDIKEAAGVIKLRDYFINKIKEIDLDIKLNGPTGKDRLPNNINISVPGLDPAPIFSADRHQKGRDWCGVNSENLLLELDKYGISAGSGSACTSRAVEPSHVLKAIGVEKRYLQGALRFSMGRQTTKKDLDYVLKVFPKIVSDLKNRYKNN